MSISRIYRLLRLITLLQSGRGFSADELANELEVSRRTVFRDLNMLEMAHIPYYYDAERNGYRISRHFFLPPINLTLAESLAVLMLTGRLRGTGKLPLMTEASRAAMKVESALPPEIRQHVGSVLDRLGVSLGPTSRHEGIDDLFDKLIDAIVARKACRLVYISFLERRQIHATVHPLRLLFVNRAWYLIAHSPRHRQRRTFKLGRIRKLTVSDQTFVPPEDVDEADLFGAAWSMITEGRLYDIHLHFEKMVAGNVAEVQWHPSQQVDWNDDGSIEFRVRVDGLREITWWVLGYGDQVEVLAPEDLRRRIHEVADVVAARHQPTGG
ncbi:MAG TPA: YafY family protein [Phycisphaerae bacterium]|nr:YafY family protein [Phycisphaerae bacterium]